MTSRSHHPGFPARPWLRPGARVCRRADGELQVGLEPGLALVVPDTAEVRALLDGLRQGVAPAAPADLSPTLVRVCSGLLEHHLVVDGDAWLAALGDTATDDARAGVTAAAAEAGTSAGAVLRRRRLVGVHLDDGLGRGDRLREHLAGAGIATVSGDLADLVVLLRGTEPDREEVDHWVRTDTPHVLLAVVDGMVRLGPFVHPGRTACLRCVDAHHTERDPRRALVVQQYAEQGPCRDPGLPDPVPTDLLELALGYLARDVTRWVDGVRPTTWSTTVRVDPTLDLPRTPWPRHQGCGCSWAGSPPLAVQLALHGAQMLA